MAQSSIDSILIKNASSFSLITAIVICVIKIYALSITASQSMLASLVDSSLDILSSLINFIIIRIATKPPDYQHRFGHEKFEDLAIFAQALFFCCSSFFACFSAIMSITSREIPANSTHGVNLIYICSFLTIMLIAYQYYVIKITNSSIIKADKLHYVGDLMTNLVVIISLELYEKFWFIDAVGGIAISCYIIRGSYLLFKKVIGNLVDEEFLEEDRQKIIAIISSHEEVKGLHELKTRRAANKRFIQFHIELDGRISLYEAHKISDDISFALLKQFPEAEITIHQDPAGVELDVNYRETVI